MNGVDWLLASVNERGRTERGRCYVIYEGNIWFRRYWNEWDFKRLLGIIQNVGQSLSFKKGSITEVKKAKRKELKTGLVKGFGAMVDESERKNLLLEMSPWYIFGRPSFGAQKRAPALSLSSGRVRAGPLRIFSENGMTKGVNFVVKCFKKSWMGMNGSCYFMELRGLEF